MTLCEDLGPDYRFSEKDWNKHLDILSSTELTPNYEDMRSMTSDEAEFVATVTLAEQLRQKLGFWPTAATVQEEINKEAARLSAIADAKEKAWKQKQSK